MKTIKQIAAELGESKQRVYRFALRQNIDPAEQRGNTWYYDEPAETRIKQAVYDANEERKKRQETHQKNIETNQEKRNESEANSDSNHTRYYDMTHISDTYREAKMSDQVARTLNILQQQLDEKDKQIHELNELLKEAMNLTDQQQQLQLHQAHLLTAGGSASEPVDVEEAEEEEDGDQAETDTDTEPSAADEAEPEAETPPEEKAEEEAPAEPAEPAADQVQKKSFWSRFFGG